MASAPNRYFFSFRLIIGYYFPKTLDQQFHFSVLRRKIQRRFLPDSNGNIVIFVDNLTLQYVKTVCLKSVRKRAFGKIRNMVNDKLIERSGFQQIVQIWNCYKPYRISNGIFVNIPDNSAEFWQMFKVI